MILNTISRTLFSRNAVNFNVLKGRVNYNKNICFKNLCCSAAVHRKEHIYKSPHDNLILPNITVLDFLRQKSQNFDDRIALICAESGEELRYGELWEKVQRMGSGLAKLGVGKTSTVALASPNCPEYVVTFLAAAATGATVTTVNSLYTAEEISRQLSDSEASVVLYHPGTAATVIEATQMLPPGAVTHRICTHDPLHTGDLSFSALCEDDGLACPKNPDVDISSDVLVLPYSSGTTGLSKGVMLTNANVTAVMEMVSHPRLAFDYPGGVSVMFAVLPMFHIYGMVACIFVSLLTGSKCVTFTKFDPRLYLKSLVQHKPTVLHVVPPILNFLVQAPQVLPEYMASLRTVVCGAAPMATGIVQSFHDKFGENIQFQEGYGMTELSPAAIMSPLDDYIVGSCGVPVPNTMCKLVHIETGETLDPDEGEGEICVKGPQIMKGYFKNPEATSSTIDSEGWLHTGDVARVDSRGHFYIVDRIKELIKVKGFQVAPAELETVLRECPGVLEAAVIGVPDSKSGEVPRAYIVKAPEYGSLTAEQVQKFTSERVAEHKNLSGGVVFIDAIPKNVTGKILRKELRNLALT